jgi:predicted DNA-binding transcriptional regulator AlpA
MSREQIANHVLAHGQQADGHKAHCQQADGHEAHRQQGDFGTGAVTAAGAVSFEPFINKPEVARRLGCAMRTLDSWMKRGIVPFYKVSKRVMFRWSEVQEVLERNCRVDQGGWKV